MSVKKSDERVEGINRAQDSCHRDLMDIRRRIQFHRAMGIEEYPRNADVESFFSTSGHDTLKARQNNPAEKKRIPSAGSPERIWGEQSNLPAIAQEVHTCTRCDLSARRSGTVSGQGYAGVKLMVVGDWSMQDADFKGEILFGRQEDEMLWKMMTAIDLDGQDVYVTNCIKCCPVKEVRPDAEAEKSCFSYLEREIAAVRPQIICAMGDTAARILLGSTVPLVRLRGKLGSYRYQSSGPISVMPTFHPSFLLRSPEMKKATWNDLQMIKRYLDEERR